MVPGDLKEMASLGLLGMQERAMRLGGAVQIDGARGAGTRIAVSIPIPSGSLS
jgi:signal transduction histidine kinase